MFSSVISLRFHIYTGTACSTHTERIVVNPNSGIKHLYLTRDFVSAKPHLVSRNVSALLGKVKILEEFGTCQQSESVEVTTMEVNRSATQLKDWTQIFTHGIPCGQRTSVMLRCTFASLFFVLQLINVVLWSRRMGGKPLACELWAGSPRRNLSTALRCECVGGNISKLPVF